MRWEKLDRQCVGCNAFRRLEARSRCSLFLLVFAVVEGVVFFASISLMPPHFRAFLAHHETLMQWFVVTSCLLFFVPGFVGYALNSSSISHVGLTCQGKKIHLHPEMMGDLVYMMGDCPSLNGWRVTIPNHLRWISFSSSTGNVVWTEGGGTDLKTFLRIVGDARDGMRSLLDAHLKMAESLRQLCTGSIAAAVFMEETGAIERVKPLRESRRLLGHVLRDVGKSYVGLWSCEHDAARLLPRLRQELGLKYGPKPKTV